MQEPGAAGRSAALGLGVFMSLGLIGPMRASGAPMNEPHPDAGSPASPAVHSPVIPLPAEIVPRAGSFTFGSEAAVRVPAKDPQAQAAAHYLIDLLTRSNGITLPLVGATSDPVSRPASTARALPAAPPGRGTITFRRTPGLGPEAYRLEVAPRGITVSASTGAGLFYGAITLWQLVPLGRSVPIAAQIIRDRPQYAWRGLMLDSARHFQSPAFIRGMLDWMSWHKLNVLHWHLTDDQGWRLEIRRYPRLTSVGGWRTPATPALAPATATRRPAPGDAAAARYGGFYTQDEVRGIVAYAAARHVQIVPEIEMPGHATAAIAAYPHLGAGILASGEAPPAVSSNWGVHSHLFNLEPATFDFLKNVLAEVIELFPGPYVHVGGDEAVKDEWRSSPSVQARARALAIPDADALQAYFTQEIGRYLTAHGRRLIGWDEILRPGLAKDAIVMSWHGAQGARAAAAAGNDTILAPWPTLYFDNRQSTLPSEPPGRLKVVSLEDVYRFEPRDPAASAAELAHVLGVQANLWTEHIQTEDRVVWMALPRAAAVAELGWSTPDRRHWPEFLERVVSMSERYAAFGLPYADSVFAIQAQVSGSADGVTLALSNQAQAGEIKYTLDGGAPTAASAVYRAPLVVPLGTEVRAAAFVGAHQASHTWVRQLDARSLARRDSHELELCSNAIGLLLEPATGNTGSDNLGTGNTGSPNTGSENLGTGNPRIEDASDGERGGPGPIARSPLAVDIMNPCWIDRDVDLTHGPRIIAAVAPLPFNYELGADVGKIRVGDARTADGELEVHVDSCAAPTAATLVLAPAAAARGVTVLPAQMLAPLAGRHDLCLRFARPRLDPLWALDWVRIGE